MFKETVIEDTQLGSNSICNEELHPGEKVGQYKIYEELGVGGLACVYKVYDEDLERYAALKILRPGVASSDTAKKRFKQEINLLAKLSMPGCVSVFGAGEHRGMLYCAMEFIEGRTLRQLIHEDHLTTNEALKILIKVAEIIKELHKRGLEHRDIKPGNIMLTQYDEVILLDFGLAKAVENELNICVTAHGELFGTPAYMSPEQGGKENKLYRAGCSDVYALGVLAFELLTGHLPYAIENLSLDEVFYVIRNEKPDTVKMYNSEVPSAVDNIINQALNKEPSERISSEEFWNGLKRGRKGKLFIIYHRVAAIVLACVVGTVIALILVSKIPSDNILKMLPGNNNSGNKSPIINELTANAVNENPLGLPGTDIKMVKIDAGTFVMGNGSEESSSSPVHGVVLSNAYFIGTHEITGRQYATITGNAPKGQAESDMPITNISWHDANKFCRMLTIREKNAGRLPDGKVFRLPTEAEWEYACRAGSDGKYFFGDIAEELSDYAVFGHEDKAKAGTKKPNKYGLYDTLGNAWEWCYDNAGKYSTWPKLNPITTKKPHLERIIRGGAANCGINECTNAERRAVSPNHSDPLIGFRVVLGKKI
jgi:eukaryotic-like serine/threonine-protein kinase